MNKKHPSLTRIQEFLDINFYGLGDSAEDKQEFEQRKEIAQMAVNHLGQVLDSLEEELNTSIDCQPEVRLRPPK